MWSRSNLFITNCRFALTNRFRNLEINGNRLESECRSFGTEVRNRLAQLGVPEKPKRPLTPYIRFVREKQADLVRQHPDWKQTQVFKKLAEDWRSFSEVEKERFVNEFKRDRERYDKLILEYQGNLTPSQKTALEQIAQQKHKEKEERKLKKFLKDTNKPKKPVAAYMLFLLEQSKMRNISIKDLMSAKEWDNLSQAEKEKYNKQYEINKQQYEVALNKWEDQMIKAGHTDLVRLKRVKEPQISRIKATKSQSK